MWSRDYGVCSHLVSLPGNGHKGEHTHTHSEERGEGVDPTIHRSEKPLSVRCVPIVCLSGHNCTRVPVQHEDEAGDAVEHGHAHVGHGQVDQEVVGDASHSPVSWTE